MAFLKKKQLQNYLPFLRSQALSQFMSNAPGAWIGPHEVLGDLYHQDEGVRRCYQQQLVAGTDPDLRTFIAKLMFGKKRLPLDNFQCAFHTLYP